MLIDLHDADASILTTYGRHLAPIYVPEIILREVEQLDTSKAESLGLTVVEPTFQQFALAAKKRGALSVADHLCPIMAKENGWTAVSNDTALRGACKKDGVPTLWGLEVITQVVTAGFLSRGSRGDRRSCSRE